MRTGYSKVVWTIGLLSVSVAALAGEPKTASPQEPAGQSQGGQAHAASPQEPAGFIAGGVIGGLAAGPLGVVVGAGIGTWLGNRVHRAAEATRLEAQVGGLRAEQDQLKSQNAALSGEKGDLLETNRALTARLDQLSQQVEAAQLAQADGARSDAPRSDAARSDAARSEAARGDAAGGGAAGGGAAGADAAQVLDGLQGDVLFRTGSADLSPEMAHGIEVLAQAVAKSPDLKVRVDGFADPRGTVAANLKLSEARADAVRDVFLAAGVDNAALEINAYGKSQSIAADADGYALERRVRLTLQAPGAAAAVANTGGSGDAGATAALQAGADEK
jgi:outer membrane protein OmpA-like peptidoglycan-associated protein